MTVKYYVGLDIHMRRTSICILNANGKTVKTQNVRGRMDKVLKVLRRIKGPWSAALEASCGYGVWNDALRKLGADVTVAHPAKIAAIARSKTKNDRNDAELLARMLMLDMLPTVHVPSVEVRAWRELITHRESLVKKRTRLKQQIRALLRGQGITAPKSLWAKKTRPWFRELPLAQRAHRAKLDSQLRQLDLIEEELRYATRELNAIAAGHPAVMLLRTIPGVGPRTAESVAAWIDQPERFRNSKCVSAYFGLVPCQDASGSRNRLGHITRNGPSHVRRLLTEAVWQGIRRSPKICAYYERIRRDDPERRKIAVVATMHYLVRVMHGMLRSGELWREDAA